jgi:membrane protein implicated in regulation of membrane protease activity
MGRLIILFLAVITLLTLWGPYALVVTGAIALAILIWLLGWKFNPPWSNRQDHRLRRPRRYPRGNRGSGIHSSQTRCGRNR